MNKIMFFFLTLFLSQSLLGQSSTPNSVLEAFSKLVPTESTPYWEFREGAYVAMFSHADGLKKMFFDEKGEWLETRTRIDRQILPVGVKRFIDTHYAEANITYIGRVDQPESQLYRIESEIGTSVVIKLLSDQGVLMKEDRFDSSVILN